MDNTLNLNEQLELASKILKTNIDIVKKVSFIIPETNLLAISVSMEGLEIQKGYKGGAKTLIIDNNGELLAYTGSELSISQLAEEFKNGRRTPINQLKNW